jgi:hypothetical protein
MTTATMATRNQSRFFPLVSAVSYTALLLAALHTFFLGPLKDQAAQMVRLRLRFDNRMEWNSLL